jgi:transcriptional regulator with XRE-family HTH domain
MQYFQYRKKRLVQMRRLSIRQIKAARALLAWSQEEAARISGVSVATIKRLEASDGPVGGREDTSERLVAALESAGVIFLEENGEGPGVRLRKQRIGTGSIAAEDLNASNDE